MKMQCVKSGPLLWRVLITLDSTAEYSGESLGGIRQSLSVYTPLLI